MKIKYIDLGKQFKQIESEIMPRLKEVLESGKYILGDDVKEFEENFAKYCGTKYAIGVADGTDALILSMKALGIGKGDEVITAPNSFIATAGAIDFVGAKTVFVDVGDDFNIDSELIESAITEKTKAIIPVHLTGRPADMEKILEIGKKHEIHVIEDAAQSVGSCYKGNKVGSFGIVGCFSLHPLKNLNACGDAGVVTTNDKDIYEKILKLRNHGLKNRDESEFFGLNSRLDTVQATILNVKLKHLAEWKKRVKEIAKKYHDGLKDVVKVPEDKEYEDCFYHIFVIQSDKRDDLQEFLAEKGIDTKVHYPIPIHLQEAAKDLDYKKGDFPKVEDQASKILTLPIYPEMTDDEVNYIIEQIKEF